MPIEKPAAILRGGAKGLEIVVDGGATVETIAATISGRLAEAPAFFRGSDVRIRVDAGPLAPGCLARLDDIAGQYELRIVEVGAKPEAKPDAIPVPQVALAVGSEQLPLVSLAAIEPVVVAAEVPVEVIPPPVLDQLELALLEPDVTVSIIEEKTKVVVGPIRSGVILEHRGHLVVFGDVNPGAEIRAEGNIVVLGR
ncbi:MAG: septum site-determining protein MinC, partial [Kofleriaceae bacterium]